jgi:hypothetical protein
LLAKMGDKMPTNKPTAARYKNQFVIHTEELPRTSVNTWGRHSLRLTREIVCRTQSSNLHLNSAKLVTAMI